MSFLERHTHEFDNHDEKEEKEEEEEDKDKTDEEEEEENLNSSQDQEGGDYFDHQSSSFLQMFLPSPSWSWTYRVNEAGRHSSLRTSISLPQHLPSQPYSQGNRQEYPSSTNHNSTMSSTKISH